MTSQQSSSVLNPEPSGGPRSGACLPELLAPAGDWDCARAAVENGADAIYFGLEKFNARMRARNFTEPDLPPLLEFLHRRGVKGYVTFNTLIFENELAEAERYARTLIAAGADAAIVQDVGLCRLIRRLSPDFPIHVSTQMTVTSGAGVELARELGCDLAVLARECSLKDIETIQSFLREKSSERDARLNRRSSALPLEVFVHGALCVAYSGQCLTSEALGGRSANRGECAQACRMPYELVSDGKLVPLGQKKYLLSPQDLAGLEVLPELVRLGVASLKIEGRLKTPEYVANITRIYRQALDSLARNPLAPQTAPADAEHTQYEMEMAFSRGLYTGWFQGINNQRLVHAQFGKKRGVFLGEVAEIRREGVMVRLEGPVKPGDGIVFDAGAPEGKEEGGRIYSVEAAPGPERPRGEYQRGAGTRGRFVLLSFGHGDINFKRVHIGDKIWKTSDPELERRLRQSFAGDAPKHQRPISFEVHGAQDTALTLIARDELGHVARAASAMTLARAEKQPLTLERLRTQLGRLGGTPFKLAELTSHLNGEVLLPVSELNRLRREVLRELEVQRARPPRWRLEADRPDRAEAAVVGTASSIHRQKSAPRLLVLIRKLEQLAPVLESGIETVYCDFENLKQYREAVSTFRGSQARTPRSEIFVAPPRIFKMGEEWTLNQVRSCEADGYLVRNYDHLSFFAGARRVGDYSLNIANRLSAEYFKEKFSLERVTASYDLNSVQLEALLGAVPPEWVEITIHQHMPMFHMEHCVFCAFLSSGTDYTNCGRPCDRHDVRLRDRVGAEHPVKADAGCRNTVFNALAQTGAEFASRMLGLGARHFRLEFLNESPAQVKQTIAKYQQLLRGEITGRELWSELKLLNQLGVTRGPLAP